MSSVQGTAARIAEHKGVSPATGWRSAPTRLFYRFFLQLFAHRLVRATYHGILGRAPEANGLSNYAKELAARKDLAWLVADVAKSEEAQRSRPARVSREDVLWCYHALLNREPESEEVIKLHSSAEDLKILVKTFIESEEFRNRQGTTAAPFHKLDLHADAIESKANADQLEQAWLRVRTAWEHLGKVKPHFSVLTNPHFLPDQFEGSADRFWESGEAEAATLERPLMRYGLGKDLSQRVCVEYGCGVGRVTMGLAKRFGTVHAYDISHAHLELARQRALKSGRDNIRFHQCIGNPRGKLRSCDFFYSRIVFQHNPPPIIRELILAALESLRPGGIAIFQVPTFKRGYRFKVAEWLKATQPLDMEMHALPQSAVFEIVAEAGCMLLEIREDNSTGAPHNYLSNVFVVQKK